jgi:ribosomal protein S18 acetylase RimI-like enzyme
VAAIDAAARAGAVLPRLGVPFLTTLYRALLRTGDAVGFVSEEATHIRGFIVGCRDTPMALRRAMARGLLPLAVKAAARCVAEPSLIPLLFQTLAYPRQSAGGGPELLVISVDPAHHRHGVGKALVEELNRAFIAQGIARYHVTVKASLDDTNAFYRRLRFLPAGEVRMYGEIWNRYEYRLSAEGDR